MRLSGFRILGATAGCILSVSAVLLALRAITLPTQTKPGKRREFPRVNFTFVRPTLIPKLKNNETHLFLVIVVSSAAWTDFKFRRDAVRETWGRNNERRLFLDKPSEGSQDSSITAPSRADAITWKTVFLFGKTHDEGLDSQMNEEGAVYNDIIMGDFTEAYENLLTKIFMGFTWALTIKCRYVLKADDDVYVRVPRILDWLEDAPRHLYAGHVHKDVEVNHDPSDANSIAIEPDKYKEKTFPPYCLGAFYIVSTSILPQLFNAVKLWRPWPIEDTYVAVLAREIGVRPVNVDGFLLKSAMGKSLEMADCELVHSKALGHQLAPSHLYLLHSKFQILEEKFRGRHCVGTGKYLLLCVSLAFLFCVIIGVVYLCVRRFRNRVFVYSIDANS